MFRVLNYQNNSGFLFDLTIHYAKVQQPGADIAWPAHGTINVEAAMATGFSDVTLPWYFDWVNHKDTAL